MKAKLLLAVILTAGLAMAAKTPQVFVEGLMEGFTKPYVEPVVTNLPYGEILVIFPDMGPKGTITFTKLPVDDLRYGVQCAANIKTKKCDGTFRILTDTLAGCKINAPLLSILNGLDCSAGSIKTIKIREAGDILAGANPKGAKLTLQSTFSGRLEGNVKAITAASYKDAQLRCTTPKTLAIKAKNKDGGTAYVNPGLSYKAKNVTVIEEEEKAKDYLKIDLQTGAITQEAQPAGWTDADKTTYLWLRRIPATTEAKPEGNTYFVMGSPDTETGRFVGETQHNVTLTKDFYIGVFELTAAQYDYITGSTSPKTSTIAKVEVSYSDLRGSTSGAGWPASTDVDSDSAIGQLRNLTASTTPQGYRFDLPTEAQWEYACRGPEGFGSTWNDGSAILSASDEDSNLDKLGWYAKNKPVMASQAVGQKTPNGWGLYDMHGNASELCLDWYQLDLGSEAVEDPKGADTGNRRVKRGGSWYDDASGCRSAYRDNLATMYSNAITGLRVALVQ